MFVSVEMRFPLKKHLNLDSAIYGFLIIVFIFIIATVYSGWRGMEKAGNESNALDFISTFRTKQLNYAAENSGAFASDFRETMKCDAELENGNVIYSDYIFSMKNIDSTGNNSAFYSINADPQTKYWFFPAGDRHFYYDSNLKTFKVTEENPQATADDPSM